MTGETARYPSSEALDRVFCKTCGTRLFSWRKNGTVAGVALAAFDDRNAFAPTEHIWVSEKIDWVKLDDGLPQYQEGVPQYLTPRRPCLVRNCARDAGPITTAVHGSNKIVEQRCQNEKPRRMGPCVRRNDNREISPGKSVIA